jgi:DNA-binding FadR family transcriptional regulator
MVGSDRPQKVAIIVAQRMIRDVARNGFAPGDLLPPERVMLETYEIGRGTLREALRLLEFQGVIALKPGPKGGPVLLNPDASHLGSNLLLLMQLKGAPFRTVVEVRSALEPVTSRLAAIRIDDESILKLDGTINDMRDNLEDEAVFLEANKEFHDIIAWSSGNPLLAYFVESLLGIMDGTVIGIDYPTFRREAILKAHEEIFAAMSSHDADGAQARMQEHIDAYVRFAERKFPEVLDRTIQWDHTHHSP